MVGEEQSGSAGAMTDRVVTEGLLRLQVVWSVLGRLFAEAPGQQVLDETRSAELLSVWPLPHGPRTAEGTAALAESATRGESGEQVRDDFQQLFVGPFHLPAPPWESVYRSRERLLFEQETLQVREFYLRHGLQAPKLNLEADDHISLELEFLARLLVRAGAAEADGDPEQARLLVAEHERFLDEHLGAWAPQFFADVEANAQTTCYRGLGILGADAVAQAVGAGR